MYQELSMIKCFIYEVSFAINKMKKERKNRITFGRFIETINGDIFTVMCWVFMRLSWKWKKQDVDKMRKEKERSDE